MVIFAVAHIQRDKTSVCCLLALCLLFIPSCYGSSLSQGQTMQAIRVSAFAEHDAPANECSGHAVLRTMTWPVNNFDTESSARSPFVKERESSMLPQHKRNLLLQ
jgi:hypothetical protein